MRATRLMPLAAALVACADGASDRHDVSLLDAAIVYEDASAAPADREDVAMHTDAARVDDASGEDAAQPVARALANSIWWLGRADLSSPSTPAFAWSGSGFEARFRGTALHATLDNQVISLTDDAFMFRAVIDGVPQPAFAAASGTHEHVLARALAPGEHTVELYRQSEGVAGATTLLAVRVEGGELLPPIPHTRRLIEVVGDSISCGYGNLGADASCPFSFATESHWDSYGAVAARALDADLSTIAASGYGLVRDYHGTNMLVPPLYELSMPEGAITTFDGRHPDVIVINLGTNDFSKGDPGAPYVTAYGNFVDSLRQRHPGALIVCAIGPMLTGASLTKQRSYVTGVVQAQRTKGDDNIVFLEFSPQTQDELGCDWHPNLHKHASMGDQLAQLLRTRLTW